MFKYFFKIALRNLKKYKIFSLINIFGLSIGITCCILAFLYVQDELKYDKHFTNTENVYILYGNNFNGKDFGNGQPARFLPYLTERLPEIESGCRIFDSELNIKIAGKHYYPKNMIFVDSTFFEFVGWELVAGDPAEALRTPMSVTISEKKAKELFADENPIGQRVLLELEHEGMITGVFKDIPRQSNIQADYIISNSSYKKINPGMLNNWGWFANTILLKLNPKTNLNEFESKLTEIWNNLGDIDAGNNGPGIRLGVDRFVDNHLHSSTSSRVGLNGNIYQVIGFALIAGFILIIACFNFINLSTALLSSRYTESGIKKIVGASKKNLTGQIVTESFLFVLGSVLLSVFIAQLMLPSINNIFDKQLELSIFGNFYLLIFLALIFFITLLGISIYPSIYFAKAIPVQILKQNTKVGNGNGLSFWKILIVSQFVIGLFLIISALVVNKQMQYIRTHHLGFNKENILVVENDWDNGTIDRYQLFRESMKKIPEVSMISSGINVPANGIWNWGMPQMPVDMSKGIPNCGYVSVDYNYFSLIGAEIIEGRDFDEKISSDKDKVIISSTARKIFDVEDPIGKMLTNLWDGKDREIIGVVNDIQYNTIHLDQKPVLFFCQHTGLNHGVHILLKINSPDLTQTMKKIRNIWESQNPTRPFGSFFLDETFESNYRKEAQTALIMKILTYIAIFLCGLGLFGLSLFIINKKTKEIGIRKVNGAKITEVVIFLNRDFVKWIFIAYVIAMPLAFYITQKWLQNFSFKTEINWWIFAIAGLFASGVAIITVSWQSWRAASRNPVEALRYE